MLAQKRHESRYDRRLGPASPKQRLIPVWGFELLYNDVSWEIRLGRGYDELISEIPLSHVVQESLVHQIIVAQSKVKSIVCTAIDPHWVYPLKGLVGRQDSVTKLGELDLSEHEFAIDHSQEIRSFTWNIFSTHFYHRLQSWNRIWGYAEMLSSQPGRHFSACRCSMVP